MANSDVELKSVSRQPDYATILGLIGAICMIGLALFMGGQIQSFFNSTALLIVIGGTIAVTAMSFSVQDLSSIGSVFGNSFFSKSANQKAVARQMMDMAVVVRRKGPLVLQNLQQSLGGQRFLNQAVELVMDGVTPEEIERVLVQDMEAYASRYEHSINMLRRAAEVAPAMGLIGTLVGLVQMLATLEDPSSIGPSMAVALLTTFYGAILGTVFLAPLAAKLEKRMNDEFIVRSMILLTSMSMARKENPRRLELLLNTTLPPESRIKYFSEAAQPKETQQ